MGGWTERRKIGRVSEAGLMGRMSAKSMVMVHHRKRRGRRKNAAKEQKNCEEIRVEQTGPCPFGEGSLGPCTGGKAGPYDP